MQVNAESFPYRLFGLFLHIAEADFVAFDLELSGIPSRLPGKPARRGARYTLEERYAETKQAADRYHILQVGLTCARFDYLANQYVLRPYNINLSPLLDQRLDLEREISLQSGACSFLLHNGFDLGAPFATGVQYLSREEAERARQLAWDRLDGKNPVQDLQLNEADVDSLDFVRRVREAITKWKTTPSEALDITTYTGLVHQPPMQAISRFEKRLVHQLVRAEFPEQVSIGRNNCIRIIDHNAEREADNTRRNKSRVKEQIMRQTGFRWIFEALAKGGTINRADPLYLPRNGLVTTPDALHIKDGYDRAVERLKSRQPVLVGHNMFTDIVYLYRTFVGPLPETLQGFREAIHELFPNIIDTKYLATYAEGDLNASPTLQEIAQGLATQPLPVIVTHADHAGYENTEAFHEAGYDSLLTATIMIRLAAKLGAQRLTEASQRPSTPLFTNGSAAPMPLEDFMRDGQGKAQIPVSLPPLGDSRDPAPSTTRSSRRRKAKRASKTLEKAAKPRFDTSNPFDSLRTLSLDPGAETDQPSTDDDAALDLDAIKNDKLNQEEQTQIKGSWADPACIQNNMEWAPIEQMQRQAMEMIPAFEHGFWDEFGNKLRVFGTQEAVLDIAPWKR